MGLLDDRRAIMADNDRILQTATVSQDAPGAQLTLRCECAVPGCSSNIQISCRDVRNVRSSAEKTPGIFLAKRRHEIRDLEDGSDLFSKDKDWIQVTPRSSWAKPLDLETMKACVATESAEAAANRTEVEAGQARVTALAATGALVLGLFATLRPDIGKHILVLWLLLPLVPLAGLLWEGTAGTARVRGGVRKGLSPGRHLTMEELGEWDRERYKLRLRPAVEIVRAPGVSYESAVAYKCANQHDPFSAMAYLKYADYLAFELQRQARRRIIYLEAIYEIEGRERRGRGWLAALVIYVVVAMAFL
jgi:hypothetical protein